MPRRPGRAPSSRRSRRTCRTDPAWRSGRPAAFPGSRDAARSSERKLLPAPLEEVRDAALAFIVPPLEAHGYLLHQEGHDVLVFTSRYRGDRIMVRFRDAGDRQTLVLAHGTAPLRVRRAFAQLDD